MMSRRIIATFVVLLVLLTGCKVNNPGALQEDDNPVKTESSVLTDTNESKEQTEMKIADESTLANNQIRVTVGSSSFIVNTEAGDVMLYSGNHIKHRIL